eukprot:1256578-Rhodomonas_salina.2
MHTLTPDTPLRGRSPSATTAAGARLAARWHSSRWPVGVRYLRTCLHPVGAHMLSLCAMPSLGPEVPNHSSFVAAPLAPHAVLPLTAARVR